MRALQVTAARVLVCLSAVFCLFLRPCHAGKDFTVLTSFYPMYIMTVNVAGGITGVTVSNLTPPVTGCLHEYSLTTENMKKIDGADVLVVNGAGMESFLDKAKSANPRLQVVTLSDGVPLITQGGAVNPHVWVSVSGAMTEVRNLVAGLSKADPAHRAEYEKNGGAYLSKLEALRARMEKELAPFRGRQIITFHEAFPYFAREFGLRVAAVIEREPGSSPSARELAQTVDIVRRAGIKALFVEPQYSPAAAETIARETGTRVNVLDPAVTGPDEPDAYLAVMERNLETLKQALGGEG
ncbi:MAG: metal ABC transporter substrate-binding protein [Deltaproteobacteria bacterium]